MATAQELEVAAWIAALTEELYEVEVGPATERDGEDGSGLTNDFTYEEVDPRIAVGVTRLRDDFESPSAEEQAGLRDRLERFVGTIRRDARPRRSPTRSSSRSKPRTISGWTRPGSIQSCPPSCERCETRVRATACAGG